MNTKPDPTISAIAATSINWIIGRNNQLPWHLPADLKHFKNLTTGHPIIMGRKTHESIGKPLPNRTNIVVTRDATYHSDGCLVAASLPAAIQLATNTHCTEMFIIGGAEIYRLAMPLIQRLYLTIIDHHIDGDASFPTMNMREWREISEEKHQADSENQYDYRFLVFERYPPTSPSLRSGSVSG